MTFQCISVLIQSDSSSEQDTECFTFRISAADTVSGLTLDPAQASVCIIDQGGKYISLHCSYTHTFSCTAACTTYTLNRREHGLTSYPYERGFTSTWSAIQHFVIFLLFHFGV